MFKMQSTSKRAPVKLINKKYVFLDRQPISSLRHLIYVDLYEFMRKTAEIVINSGGLRVPISG